MPAKRTSIAATFSAAAVFTFSSVAFAEPMTANGRITDIFGHRLVVEGADSRRVLINLGPTMTDLSSLRSGDTVTIEGEMHRSGELQARSVTLPDGKTVLAERDRKTWTNWLTGDNDEKGLYSSEQAMKIATDGGYAVTGDLRPEKGHFEAVATKDGKSYDIAIHRDGDIDADDLFDAAMATKEAADEGYTVVGQLNRVGRHFEGQAQKDGTAYRIEVERDGDIEAWRDFSVAEVKAKVSEAGYQIKGEPVARKRHYEALATKDGAFYEIHVEGDGDVDRERAVEANDPKWAAQMAVN